jgi:hypothetical protein
LTFAKTCAIEFRPSGYLDKKMSLAPDDGIAWQTAFARRVSQTLCKLVSVSLPLQGDSHTTITPELLDQSLAKYTKAEDLLGKKGLLK